jgi:RNA polymerase sigma factor (TIGR02999 family)
VNEAWLRLFGQRAPWEGRQHFLAIAATVMRRLLADHAKQKRTEKRGQDWGRVTLAGVDLASAGPELDLVALDEALDKLAALHARQARVVELRFFSGLTVEEVAAAMDVSRSTAEAEWRAARAWLRRELGGS